MKIFNFAVVFYEELCYNIYSRKVGADIMPNIKPVSDLRNYTEVLRDIAVGDPVFLTKTAEADMLLSILRNTKRQKRP